MGLWAKMKGVFSRIGSGIKKGFDWLTGNRDKIKSAIDTAQQFVPDKYKDKVTGLVDRGGALLDKAQGAYDAAQGIYNRFKT